MTLYLADHATYQNGVTVADYQRAGIDVVNWKISHGVGQSAVRATVKAEAEDAQNRGLARATFHWLTGDTSGRAQADYAYARIRDAGLADGTMHTVDVESTTSPPGFTHISDYAVRMQQLLGRPICLYTGDWWWTAVGRRWDGHAITPYLMGAPNQGYLGTYPGDGSAHWRAAWGGWSNLAVMQYAVAPLTYPSSPPGTVKVSKSAIRDHQIWRTLAGTE